MSPAATISPLKDNLNVHREDTYLDFLVSIQNRLDDVNIPTLKKAKAEDIYDQLLAYQLTPFDRRPFRLARLSAIKTALSTALETNNQAIIAFNDSIEVQARENREDDRVRMYLPNLNLKHSSSTIGMNKYFKIWHVSSILKSIH